MLLLASILMLSCAMGQEHRLCQMVMMVNHIRNWDAIIVTILLPLLTLVSASFFLFRYDTDANHSPSATGHLTRCAL